VGLFFSPVTTRGQKSLETRKFEDEKIMVSESVTRTMNLNNLREIFNHVDILINVVEGKQTNTERTFYTEEL
jgi:hypothetical protein